MVEMLLILAGLCCLGGGSFLAGYMVGRQSGDVEW